MRNLFLSVERPYTTLQHRCDIIADHLFAASSDPFNGRSYLSAARADIMAISPEWLAFREDARPFVAELWSLVDAPTNGELMDAEEVARGLAREYYAKEIDAENA